MKLIKIIGSNESAKVDDKDYTSLASYAWYMTKDGYAFRMHTTLSKRTSMRMHRQIMSPDSNIHVDHINGDKLDNRRSNLRLATHSQNMCNMKPGKNNKSGYRGISYYKKTGKWQAYITFNHKTHHLGLFQTIEEAVSVRREAAIVFHGVYASL